MKALIYDIVGALFIAFLLSFPFTVYFWNM
jgi:hypothetical protein